MPTLLHTLADSVLKRIRRFPRHYQLYNTTRDIATSKSYTQYAHECMAAYEAKHGTLDLPSSPLLDDASTLIRGVFPKQKSLEYSAKITDLIERKDPSISYSKDGLCMHVAEPIMMLGTDLMDVLRKPEVHQSLLSFFRGHYRVEWIVCYRSIPTENVAGSWLWHSDSFPPYTCKLSLHLTRTTAETGAMEIMNREDTMAYRRAGYFGEFKEERLSDLHAFAKKNGLPYRPIHFDADPGDALLFDMNYFHRAVAPRKEFRDIVQFLFLPNMISWEEQLKRDGGIVMRSKRKPGKLPKDPRPTAIATTSGSLSMM